MTLDLIVATYNRAHLLPFTLESLLAAPKPAGMQVLVAVVDNNSRDDTREVVRQWIPRFDGRLSYLFERTQGKSSALNHAISVTNGQLVGFIDDDEEIDSQWYHAAFSVFQDATVDFAGGVTIPKFDALRPDWLPSSYPAVIGSVYGGAETREYGKGYDGVLMGGNAIVRRTLLRDLGKAPYRTDLGRIGTGLLTADDDFFSRLLQTGGRGLYIPDLIVHHRVSPHMLTKRYHIRWCFWNAVSLGVQAGSRPQLLPKLFGIPRWYFRPAAVGVLRTLTGSLRPGRGADLRFSAQLDFVRLVGLLYGRHIGARGRM